MRRSPRAHARRSGWGAAPRGGVMRTSNTFVVLRSIVAVLVAALAAASFANGRVVLGVILTALAITNVAITVTLLRHRADLARRFPGVARARRERKGHDPIDQSAGA